MNIKTFIEENEKLDSKEFYSDYYHTGKLSYIEEDGTTRADIQRIIDWWNFRNSSRQISLIKMIVEIVESEKVEQPEYGLDNYEHEEADEASGFNKALNTISSKLLDLLKD